MAGLLLAAAATRLPFLRIGRFGLWPVVGVLLLAIAAIWSNATLPLKLYPVLINCTLLVVFAYSLFSPPSIIERMARLREPNFPPAAVFYTRRVTQVWCGFFVMNGVIALGTALWASEAVWSLYTSLISYVLMGALFGVEYLYRLRFKRLHHV